MDRFCFEITEEMEDERIDKCLTLLMDSLSRSYIQKLLKEEQILVNEEKVKANYRLKYEDEIKVLIREGAVMVNGVPVKGSYRMRVDDSVSFLLPDAVEPNIEAENIPLDILYEDKYVIVVNKPKGMVVHPASGHYSHTMVNALMYHCREGLSGVNGSLRPGIVHRIDVQKRQGTYLYRGAAAGAFHRQAVPCYLSRRAEGG